MSLVTDPGWSTKVLWSIKHMADAPELHFLRLIEEVVQVLPQHQRMVQVQYQRQALFAEKPRRQLQGLRREAEPHPRVAFSVVIACSTHG